MNDRGIGGVFFFKQKTTYEVLLSLVVSEMYVRGGVNDSIAELEE